MAKNVLEKIIDKKIEKIVNLKKTISLESLDELINTNKTFIDFKEKIKNNIKEDKYSVIAEIKKASPSAGIIIKDYDPVNIASVTINTHFFLLPNHLCVVARPFDGEVLSIDMSQHIKINQAIVNRGNQCISIRVS